MSLSKSVLFSPLRVGSTIIQNRFLKSPTWESLADDVTGLPKPQLLKMVHEWAIGETGIVIPGYVYPVLHGKAMHNQTGMEYWCHAEAWQNTISDCHVTGSKVIFQIGHGGVRGAEAFWNGE
jgi:2,4-dienoyl-CoA reductase-like NADH-dependent reductase (Old Yellow Enzyme family)